jgi:hypothetical protein
MYLFWRQKRKGMQDVGATRLALTTNAVSFAQIHLHFVIREGEGAPHNVTSGLRPVAASRQTRVAMEHQSTITRSRMYLTHLHRAQSIVQVSSLRHAENHSIAKQQVAAQFPDFARQPIAPPTITWGRARTRSRALEQGGWRAHFGNGVDEKSQTFRSVPTYKVAPNVFRSNSAVARHAVPPRSQENTAAQLYFQPQKLVWRRVLELATEKNGSPRPWDPEDFEEQSESRSFKGKERAFRTPHSSGYEQATPVLKIDPSLIDRMADDVIRKLERRARIERARQGL